MTRHSKVFVPVFGKDADHIFTDDKFQFPVKEKENVYILTEQELKGIAVKLLLARDALVANNYNEVYHQLYSIASPNFDKHSDDVWSGIELIAGEEYIQSKTNPQTENK